MPFSMRLTPSLLLTVLSCWHAITYALPSSSRSAPPPATLIHQFPNGMAVENLAIRNDGSILCTSLYTRQILYVNPQNPANAYSVGSFPPGNTMTGLTEHGDDIFVFTSTGFEPTTHQPSGPGTEKLWSVDLRGYNGTYNASLPFQLISNVTKAGFLDGLTSLDGTDYVLASDGRSPIIWRINAVTGAYDVSLNASVLAPTGNGSFIAGSAIGANGLVYRAPYVYFTNTAQSLFGRFSVGPSGTANGAVEILGQNLVSDDLQPVHRSGVGAYLTDPNQAQIVYAPGTIDGDYVPITTVGGPTSVRWGRTPQDQLTLYISSTGNDSAYAGVQDPASTLTVGGALHSFTVNG